jgi:organic anion transporter 4A
MEVSRRSNGVTTDETVLLEEIDIGTESEDASEAEDTVMFRGEPLENEVENEIFTPPELLKSYSFGCGPFHPSWLQKLANRKVFTSLLCMFGLIEGSIVTGLTSVVLRTVEKRYNLTSTAVGFIPVCFDVAVTLCVVFISYFGGRSHKPRWLGICMIILSIGSFIFASPQFLLGQYVPGGDSSHHYSIEMCNDNRNFTSTCSSSDFLAFSLLIVGKFLIGIGSAPLYTVGQAYLDEIVFPKYISLHMGMYHAMGVFGPVVGYGLGSLCLLVYVDPWVSTTLVTTSPAWVGAWWIPFLLMGLMSIVTSVPFLMFPRYLPDSYLVRKERIKEMAKTYSSLNNEEESLLVMIKMFPLQLKRVVLNFSFIFISLSTGGLFILTSGLVSFAPQFLEIQFYLTDTTAGLVAGGVGIIAAIGGVLSGALIIYIFKLKGTKITILGIVVSLLLIPMGFGVLLHCPSLNVVGITTPYYNSSIDDNDMDSAACVSNCGCSSHVFEPVCGADGLTYFSPCRAGCISTLTDNGTYEFANCSCIAENLLDSELTNLSYSEALHQYSFATNDKCESYCNLLIPFLFLTMFLITLPLLMQIPMYYFTMRLVL